jgi:hypothetical protein
MKTGKGMTYTGVILAALVLAALLPASTMAIGQEAAGAPTLITYQGYLEDAAGDPVDGQVDIQVGIYAGASGGSPLWEEIQANVDVADGYFTIYLGSVGALDASIFDGTERWLQVSVDAGSGYEDLPRQQVASVPYALQAEEAASAPWAGLTGVPTAFPPEGHHHDGRYYTESELNTGGAGGQVHWNNLTGVPAGFADGTDDVGASYGHVVVVAKSGGDYTGVQAAINSIAGASASNPYLVWVAPGEYDERVTMKPYVHVRGAGQETTIITNDHDGGTLILADHATLQDLTVLNTSTSYYAMAIVTCPTVMIPDPPDLTGARLRDVTAEVQASGQALVFGLHLACSGTDILLEDVTATAENGSIRSHGMIVVGSAQITVRGGAFAGHGGDHNSGVYSSGGATSMAFSIVEGTDNSIIQDGGAITLTHSTLVGGPASGSVTCVAVSRGGTFSASGCP